MASPGGTSSASGSSLIRDSPSSEDLQLQAVLDQRKRKRMISNRESARRSRMRKQKRLDDLRAQVEQLTEENHQISTNIGLTTRHYLSIQSDNSILRAQVEELRRRLESLDEIIVGFLSVSCVPASYGAVNAVESVDGFSNPFHHFGPALASAETFQC